MKSILLGIFSAITFAFILSSCETLDKGPEPPREKLSSMPHNMPQPWEGSAGLPGLAGGGY